MIKWIKILLKFFDGIVPSKKIYDIEICENFHRIRVLKTKNYYACWECWRNWEYYNQYDQI
jgi:hypothetical protein